MASAEDSNNSLDGVGNSSGRSNAAGGGVDASCWTIAADAVVSSHATLIGRITVGASTIIHPKATIDAGDGEIILGSHNIVEEMATIENLEPDTVMRIGNDNLFEVGSICYAKRVGDNNVFGIKSEVGRGVTVPDGCQLGPRCQLIDQTPMPSNTVVYTGNNLRRTASERPNQRSQAEFLKKLLPKYMNTVQNVQPK